MTFKLITKHENMPTIVDMLKCISDICLNFATLICVTTFIT